MPRLGRPFGLETMENVSMIGTSESTRRAEVCTYGLIPRNGRKRREIKYPP